LWAKGFAHPPKDWPYTLETLEQKYHERCERDVKRLAEKYGMAYETMWDNCMGADRVALARLRILKLDREEFYKPCQCRNCRSERAKESLIKASRRAATRRPISRFTVTG
jgi:hypothetical protein